MTEPSPGTLVDSNVLFDLVHRDAAWVDWSRAAFAAAADDGPVLINLVVYAEVSVGFAAYEDFDDALAGAGVVRVGIPWEAGFLASRAFLQYRRRGGMKRSPPPDFFIGAHAAVLGLRVLTRDASRYRTYFPTVELITP